MHREVDLRMFTADVFIRVKAQGVTEMTTNAVMVKHPVDSACRALSIGLRNKICKCCRHGEIYKTLLEE